MKIKLYSAALLMMIFWSSTALAADSKTDTTCARVFYIKGSVYPEAGKALPNDAGKKQICGPFSLTTGKKSMCFILVNDNVEIRMDELSKIEVEETAGENPGVKLDKGEIWVETEKPLETDSIFKVNTAQGEAAFKDGIFSITPKSFKIYKGSAEISTGSGKFQVAQGYIFSEGKSRNASQDKAIPAWDRRMSDEDKLNVIADINAPDEYKNLAISTFSNIFSGGFLIDKIVFDKKEAASAEGYDIILTAGMQMTVISDEEKKITMNGSVLEQASGKNIGVIDVSENIIEAVDSKFFEKSAQAVFMKAAESAYQNVEFYRSSIASQGRTISIEVEDIGEEEKEILKTLLTELPGTNSLDEKEFYGQKTVFMINYCGSGYDIAGVLNGKKVKNMAINIWKYSKNNVKLSIK